MAWFDWRTAVLTAFSCCTVYLIFVLIFLYCVDFSLYRGEGEEVEAYDE
jgi:hypothetical protein